jgi:hypothetical protein
MYERKHEPLIPTLHFLRRLAAHGVFSLGVIALSLGAGIAGYRWLGGLGWLDATLNAAMILGGEGPVDRLVTPAAKLFASAYALYSGLVLLVAVGILLAPALHRVLHRFHLEAGRP